MTTDQPRRRYDQCDDTCTTDCGHCKGQGRPSVEDARAENNAPVLTTHDVREYVHLGMHSALRTPARVNFPAFDRWLEKEWAASRAVPSDHTATTEDTDLRDRIAREVWPEAFEPGGVCDIDGDDMTLEAQAGAYRRADRIIYTMRTEAAGLLATARSTATTEDALTMALADFDKGIERAERSTTIGPAIAIQAGAALAAAVRGLLATARPDTTTEWGVRAPMTGTSALRMGDEQEARRAIAASPQLTLVRREVTAWIEAGQ